MDDKECIWFAVCPMKRFWEQGKIESKWIENYCKGNWNDCVRFQKEMNGEYHPDNMLPNGEIDGRLD
ncbi:MAG: hypothetical protein K9G58_12460 [Bacteroidales bacterium]|nr:hypothetical protein [Bacteroidales bacterium]MCF8386753.1 hypothetical protein [Bacteroidales bacterium]MCF8398978.1 hypothetical protein [Bacteroidales bacterium]